MTDDNQRSLAETVFEREQRREKEISDAMKMEAARRSAAIENMHRLKAMRLARDVKSSNKESDVGQ
jgi:hypothetical protein